MALKISKVQGFVESSASSQSAIFAKDTSGGRDKTSVLRPSRKQSSITNSKNFTVDSAELIDDIQPCMKWFSFRLSKHSKTILLKLCKQIHASFTTQPIFTIKSDELRSSAVRAEYSTMDISSFMKEMQSQRLYKSVPDIIRDLIDTSEKKGCTYTFPIHGREVVLHLVFPKPSDANSKYSRIYESEEQLVAFFESCVHRIVVWLGVAFQYGGQRCANRLTCYLFFTDHTKILPKSNHPIGKETIDTINANTAFTTSCTPNSTIMLYRMEEWFKVFIHETFHSLGLDFSEMDTTKSNQQIVHLFPGCNRELDVRVYETYCEMWAVILHTLFIAYFSDNRRLHTSKAHAGRQIATRKRPANKSRFSVETNSRTEIEYLRNTASGKSVVNYSRILLKFERLIRYEQAYTMYQASKVLHHYRIGYRDLYENVGANDNFGRDEVSYKNELTPVFSYFIVKCVLFFHINDFLDWCYTHNHGNILYFTKTQHTIREYGLLIGRLYKSEVFIQKLEQMQEYVKKYSLKHPSRLITRTLRMTIHDF